MVSFSDDVETLSTNCHVENPVTENKSAEFIAATVPTVVQFPLFHAFQIKPFLANRNSLSLLDSITAWTILEPNVPHVAVIRLLQSLNNFHPELPKRDLLHLLENTFDRKRIYANSSTYRNSKPNTNPPPNAQ